MQGFSFLGSLAFATIDQILGRPYLPVCSLNQECSWWPCPVSVKDSYLLLNLFGNFLSLLAWKEGRGEGRWEVKQLLKL